MVRVVQNVPPSWAPPGSIPPNDSGQFYPPQRSTWNPQYEMPYSEAQRQQQPHPISQGVAHYNTQPAHSHIAHAQSIPLANMGRGRATASVPLSAPSELPTSFLNQTVLQPPYRAQVIQPDAPDLPLGADEPSIFYMRNPHLCDHGGGHYVHDEFTLPGLLIAILFFPVGIIIAYFMAQKQCRQCQKWI